MGFVWTDSYSVKVQKIDDQHKELIKLINQLHEATSVGKGKEVVGKVLGGLVDYTKMHFATEEDLMTKHQYGEFSAHKKIHDDLVRQALDLQKKHQAGSTFISVEVMTFLQNWLVHHISETDKKLGAFLNEKGIK